jgi:GntR family transcriptional regulator
MLPMANTEDGQTIKLDRTSAVPLYHQLQETLKQQIESGRWQPGHALPSEPQLAKLFGVSRVVVRMALGVLEDDHQIVRLRGRGTFVAKPKLNYRAGGLSRMLDSIGEDELAIKVLDRQIREPEEAIRRSLGAKKRDRVLQLSTLIELRGTALAIGYSFFRRDEAQWLEEAAVPGTTLAADPELSPAHHGIELTRSEVAIESTVAGKFDTDHFDLPARSAEFLISVIEHRRDGGKTRPFEVARFGYRSDILQFRLEVSQDSDTPIQATWAFVDSGWPPSSLETGNSDLGDREDTLA